MDKFIRIAAKSAVNSTHEVYKMGAVIVKGSRILSTASNRINRGCQTIRHKRWDNTLHAEAAAILKLLKRRDMVGLVNSDLYITRINKVGQLRMAKPCNKCLDLILSVGIKRVFYTTNEGTLEQMRF